MEAAKHLVKRGVDVLGVSCSDSKSCYFLSRISSFFRFSPDCKFWIRPVCIFCVPAKLLQALKMLDSGIPWWATMQCGSLLAAFQQKWSWRFFKKELFLTPVAAFSFFSIESPLAQISNGHISHGQTIHEEPAGGVPTSSIILQVFRSFLFVLGFVCSGLMSVGITTTTSLTIFSLSFSPLSLSLSLSLSLTVSYFLPSLFSQEVIVNCVVNEMIARLDFTAADFKQNHPGGALGKKLQNSWETSSSSAPSLSLSLSLSLSHTHTHTHTHTRARARTRYIIFDNSLAHSLSEYIRRYVFLTRRDFSSTTVHPWNTAQRRPLGDFLEVTVSFFYRPNPDIFSPFPSLFYHPTKFLFVIFFIALAGDVGESTLLKELVKRNGKCLCVFWRSTREKRDR